MYWFKSKAGSRRVSMSVTTTYRKQQNHDRYYLNGSPMLSDYFG